MTCSRACWLQCTSRKLQARRTSGAGIHSLPALPCFSQLILQLTGLLLQPCNFAARILLVLGSIQVVLVHGFKGGLQGGSMRCGVNTCQSQLPVQPAVHCLLWRTALCATRSSYSWRSCSFSFLSLTTCRSWVQQNNIHKAVDRWGPNCCCVCCMLASKALGTGTEGRHLLLPVLLVSPNRSSLLGQVLRLSQRVHGDDQTIDN